MINLKPYGVLMESEGKAKMGFAISFKSWNQDECTSYMIMGVANTFYEFAGQFFEDMTGITIINDDSELAPHLKDIKSLMEGYRESLSEEGVEYVFWSGLEPKGSSAGRYIYDTENLENPVKVMVKLEEYFHNSRYIMTQFPQGNENNIQYLVDSIEKDPEKLELYSDSERTNILNYSNWDQKKREAILKYMKIKNQF